MDRAMDYTSVDQGTPLPGLTFPALNRVTLARFAGAVDNYNAMHLDDRVAVAAGKPSVFAPGDLVVGYMGRVVQQAFVGASIRRFGVRMLRLLWPGDVLTCRGVVVDRREEDGSCIIDADVWADNQRGETVAKGRILAIVAGVTQRAPCAPETDSGLVYPSRAAATPVGPAARPAKSPTAGRRTKRAATPTRSTGRTGAASQQATEAKARAGAKRVAATPSKRSAKPSAARTAPARSRSR